jgi:PAT family beta-lactamase induction signal transducer AmpG
MNTENNQTEINKVKSAPLPALSEGSVLRYLSFSALYFAQGLPEGILFFGLPAWMAMAGISPAAIGAYAAVIMIPWSFKVLAAPLMDRFTYLPMGRRRPWILFGQLGLMASFLAMAFIPDPMNNLNLLMVLGFFVSLSGVFQDIAVDGMAIDIVPTNQQARANGLMWGSKTLGISASVAAGTYIYNTYGYFYAISLFSFAILFLMTVPLFLRERPGEKILPWSAGIASEISGKLQLHSWAQIFKSLYQVIFLPISILMGVAAFFYSVGRGLIQTLLPVFTVQELGWTDGHFSDIFAATNIISGLLGMFVAGALIDFFGKIRMLTIYMFCLLGLIIFMTFMKSYWHFEIFTISFFVGYFVLDTFITIAIFATAMQLCWKRISATQFTLYMAVSNVGLSVGAAILGPLKESLNWEFVILSTVLFYAVALILIRYIHFDSHLVRVNKLETAQLNLEERKLVVIPVEDPIKKMSNN